MIQRYDLYEYDASGINPQRVLDENSLGRYVRYSDHEAAIAEARADERRKCIAELISVANGYDDPEDYHRVRWAIRYAADQLKKGLTQ